MSYCIFADIKKLLPEETIIQLTDDENLKPVAIDPDNDDHAPMIGRIDEAIGAADAEIDGYCAAKYTVPLSPVPSIVNKLSVEISIYYLYSRRTVPEKIEKRYDKAIARLKDISLGRLSLGVQPVPAPAPVEAAQTNMTGRDRVFTRDKMRGF